MEGEMRSRRLDRGVRQVDAMAEAAGARPLQMVRAGADADLEEPLAAMPGELRDGVDERFLGVAVRLDLGEPFRRTRRQLASDARIGADRTAFPEGTYLLDQLASHGRPRAKLPPALPAGRVGCLFLLALR